MSYEFQGKTKAKSDAETGRRPARSQPSGGAGAGSGGGREPREPMHAFAASMGAAFLLAGIGGFIPGVTSNYDEL